MKVEMEYLEKLVKLVKDNGLTELSLEEGEKAIIIKKEQGVVQAAPIVQQAAPVAVPAAPQQAVTAPKA
jgi:acetyl-CoA carboxylase biotin carboxyl carrier protein